MKVSNNVVIYALLLLIIAGMLWIILKNPKPTDVSQDSIQVVELLEQRRADSLQMEEIKANNRQLQAIIAADLLKLNKVESRYDSLKKVHLQALQDVYELSDDTIVVMFDDYAYAGPVTDSTKYALTSIPSIRVAVVKMVRLEQAEMELDSLTAVTDRYRQLSVQAKLLIEGKDNQIARLESMQQASDDIMQLRKQEIDKLTANLKRNKTIATIAGSAAGVLLIVTILK